MRKIVSRAVPVMRRGLPAIVLLLTAGCGTMINGTTEQVPVKSDPSGAVITIECGNAPLYGGFTPMTITLQRSAEPCAITVAKEGYEETRVELKRQISRAAGANRVPGVVTGAVLGSIAFLLSWDDASISVDLTEAAYSAGEALGS